MAELQLQEVKKIADKTKVRVGNYNTAIFLLNTIDKTENVSLEELIGKLKKVENRPVAKKKVLSDVEKLALLGLVLIYLDDTYDITGTGRQVLKYLVEIKKKGR